MKNLGLCLTLCLVLCLPVNSLQYPNRIVSCTPALTEIIFALKLEAKVIGVTNNCDYPAPAKLKEKIGGYTISLEKVASLKPDIVFMQEDAQKGEIKKLVDYGLPVFSLNLRTAPEVLAGIDEIGKVTGQTREAAALLAKMRREILAIKQNSSGRPKKKVIMIVGYDPLIVVGGNNFINDYLVWAGAENIAAHSKSAYPQFSFEKLVQIDPAVIIIPEGLVKKEQVESDSRWQRLSAVRKHRLLFMDAALVSRPGPRIATAAKIVADYLYPPKW
ncbi:MAG: helical backbone metal receptor [Candidatus Margulisiibacteriota bacterium]